MPVANRKVNPDRSPAATRSRRRRAMGVVLTGLTVFGVTGCQTMGTNPLTLWRMGRDSSLSPSPTTTETGDDRNFMARWFTPKAPPPGKVDSPTLVLGSDGYKPMKTEANPEADKEFKAALELFQQGKLEEAELAFKTLAKQRKDTPWGEKGQYFLAETQFQSGKYVAAEDNFEILIKEYKGTEYVDKLVKREYEIAQVWLAQSDPKTPADKKLPWDARFTGKEPLFDSHGYALRALEHVRQNHTHGPLADIATMRIADEHMKQLDFETAAIYYDQLITEYPKSKLVQQAQLASIDARMKGYIGPEYDGAGLEKARELVKQTMATFPDRLDGTEKLYHTLDLINDQEAERTYIIAAYYKRAGYPASAEFYYAKVPQKWPKSPWAAKAKTELASLAKAPRVRHLPSKIMTQPGSSDPILGGGGGMGSGGMGMGGGGMGGGGMGGMGGMN